MVTEGSEQVAGETHIFERHEDLGLNGGGLRDCGRRRGDRFGDGRRGCDYGGLNFYGDRLGGGCGDGRRRGDRAEDGRPGSEGIREELARGVGERSGVDDVSKRGVGVFDALHGGNDGCRGGLGLRDGRGRDDVVGRGDLGGGGDDDLDPEAVTEVRAVGAAEAPVAHVPPGDGGGDHLDGEVNFGAGCDAANEDGLGCVEEIC